MPTTTQPSPTARAYAQSLLELAGERQQAEPVREELNAIGQVLTDVPSFRLFLADPGVGAEERKAVIDRAFGGRVGGLVRNVLGVLNAKGKLRELPGVIEAYNDLLDAQLGKIEVDVTVAQRLTPDQLEQVRRRVGAALGKDAVVHQYVDESIIGGLVLRVVDRLIDASVRQQLESMKQRLLAAAPR